MRSILLLPWFLLATSTLAAGDAAGQSADAAPAAQDTAAADSALVARLRDELNWRKVIRVRTGGDWYELARPRVDARGIGYETLTPIDTANLGAGVSPPIPLSSVRQIRVRKGNVKGGMIIGGIIGTGLVLTWATALAGGGDLDAEDLPLALGGSLLLGAVPGVVIGGFLGEAMYSWRPVYWLPKHPPIGRPRVTARSSRCG